MNPRTLKLTLTLLALLLVVPSIGVAGGRDDIHASAAEVQPLLPGMQAPAFTVRDARGSAVSFDPERMGQPLVVTFFRGGWCPYCNLHLAELRKAEGELKQMGFDVWFISIDRPDQLYASLEQPKTGYEILSDSELQATRAFGIAFRVPDELVAKYREYGIDLEGASGQDHHVLPAPSTFLVGENGVIQFQYTNPDYTVRLHPDVLLAAAAAYRADADQRLQRAYEERKSD